ncbi:OmpA family protein, partial [Rhizobium leguminosarum]
MFAAGLLLAAGQPFAQELSGPQVVRTLYRLQGGAPAIDLAFLMEEAAASAGKGVAALPDWQKL